MTPAPRIRDETIEEVIDVMKVSEYEALGNIPNREVIDEGKIEHLMTNGPSVYSMSYGVIRSMH